MRIVISSVQVPFIKGGAEVMTKGLYHALKREGHDVEIVTAPFKFFPERYLSDLIDFWTNQDFNSFSGYDVDCVIALQFPAYYVKHENKRLWLMHQHRAVYDIYDEKKASKELISLRTKIINSDNREFSKLKTIFTMSKNISNRLKKFNHVDSLVLYHPPSGENHFYCEDAYDYIFYPSRHETLKRQDLLIRAMKCTKTHVKALIAGMGGQTPRYSQLIEDLGLKHKVRLVGQISEREKHALYARSLAVFFAPFDEDYGYVTLEAMLSSKPVITCTDSGGPLEFVTHLVNGFTLQPHPEVIGEKIDWFYHHRQEAREMGRRGLGIYRNREITWAKVVSKLLAQ